MPVKIHAMPPSMNAVGPAILAAHAECGGLEMCNIMEGAQKSEAFTKLNAYQHIPTLEDGDFSLGESNAILRFLALKYKPELYPVAEPEACGMVDFSMDAFVSEVYSHHKDVVYTVFGFAGPPADQAASTSAYNAAMAKWGKTFLKGKFVHGDKLSIAEFKVVPFFWAAMCCEPKVDGLEVPAQIKEYVNAFFGAVDAAKIMKECGGYSIAEFAASKDKLAK
tara:strand:+ start:156 stop:821 length:666 start_codon:yes stop_codon:yes gene_type:complete